MALEREACAALCDAEYKRLSDQCCESNPEWVAEKLATDIRKRANVRGNLQ
jgi:hypothetical protein